jgi:opacity protein-like surface antigen
MKSKVVLLFVVLIISATQAVMAQGSLGFQGFGALPLNSFAKAGYRAGGGFGINYFSPTLINRFDENKLNFHIGVNSQFAFSGNRRFTVDLDTPRTGQAAYSLQNYSIGLGLVGRLVAPGERVRPYIEGFVGGRFFFTDENIRPLKEDPAYESSTRANLVKASTGTYGFGAGIMYELNDFVFMDLGFLYSKGNPGTWAHLSSARQEGNVVTYNTKKTNTDMLFINLGINFRLHCGDSDHSPDPVITPGTGKSTPTPSSTPRRSQTKLPNKVKPNPKPPTPQH